MKLILKDLSGKEKEKSFEKLEALSRAKRFHLEKIVTRTVAASSERRVSVNYHVRWLGKQLLAR